MNPIKQMFLIYLLLVSTAYAEIIDEKKNEKAFSEMSDREMNTYINLNSIQAIFDTSGLTENVRKETYSPDRIYKIRLREMMKTLLILPENEKIASYSMGDSSNFQFVPNKSDKYKLDNYAVLSGTYAGADTNLLIVGESGRVYSYYIRIDSVKSKFHPDFVHRIIPITTEKKRASLKIEDKLSGDNKKLDKTTADYLRSLPNVDIADLSFNYIKKSGDDSLLPIRIFDDGYFTYFQFSKQGYIDKPRTLPVLYRVVDGFDTPVNSRIEKGMLVAETTSDKWTLRAGEAHLCIRKEK